MIGVRGAQSAIALALRQFTDDPVNPMPRGDASLACERYLFTAGLPTNEATSDDPIAEVFWANVGAVIQSCDAILEHNPNARICVIGSEAAYSRSFDHTYASAKAALHRYVETKRLMPGQQLVAIAPGLIADAGMTERRTDQKAIEARRLAHPKQRWVTAAEVARLVHYVLYVDTGYLTGTVIRLHGGGQ